MQLTNDLKTDYQRRFDSCAIRPNRMADVDALVGADRGQSKALRGCRQSGRDAVVRGRRHPCARVLAQLRQALAQRRSAHRPNGAGSRGQAQDGAATVHLGGERERRAQIPGLRQVEGLVDPRDAVQARGLQRLRLPRPSPRRALAVSLELLEPLQPREVRGGRQVVADGGLGAVWGRGAAATDGGEEPDRLRRRAEGKGAGPALSRRR